MAGYTHAARTRFLARNELRALALVFNKFIFLVSQRPHPFATARGQRSDGRVRALRFSVLVLFFRVITISFTFFCQILGLFAQSHREQGMQKKSQ